MERQVRLKPAERHRARARAARAAFLLGPPLGATLVAYLLGPVAGVLALALLGLAALAAVEGQDG